MDVYFFRHPLTRRKGNQGPPGRFAFDAKGRCVNLPTARVEEWTGQVYADGLGPNQPGPNMDPNVFSDVLPWHLSYCRISSRDSKSVVAGLPIARLPPPVLPEVVHTGDLVVFGDFLSTHLGYVDTVMCVETPVEVPQQNGVFQLLERFGEYRARVGLNGTSWEDFLRTRTFTLNLKDSLPGGGHHETGVQPCHLQLIGRRGAPPTTDRPTVLRELLSGRGFNFIPLRAERASNRRPVKDRPGLFTMHLPGFAAMLGGTSRVVRLELEKWQHLLALLVNTSDRLVLDPLVPTGLLASAGGATC